MYRDILQTQLIELTELVSLADGAADAAATDLAEKTYCRILCHFQNLGRMDFTASGIITDHCKLLIKVAEFHLRNDEEFQAEKYLIEAVKLPAPQPFLDKIWQLLRDSLPRSSESLAALIKEKDTGQFLSPVTPEPFPPGHRVMRSGYASTAPPDLLRGNSCRDIISSPPIHTAIQANVKAVFEMIKACPERELHARDAQGHTPLFLATLLKEEFVACSIIARLSEDRADILPVVMNDRDYRGEPILNAAIRSGCCVRFIQMLVHYGAEVEPEVMLPGQLTPLQAAAQRDDFDIVSLLISNGAMTALEIA
ncbi:hypothetical protein B0O99DRAFT_146793 [Bisporella sp. PMI_857]|nr:hypothetical protein B0O99DRAFT_146793 [Bisporella sp. PMI_857]